MRTAGHAKRGQTNVSRRFFGLVGILGAAGTVAAVAALSTGNAPSAAQPASSMVGEASDGTGLSSISVLPNSIATAKDPSKPSSSVNVSKPTASTGAVPSSSPHGSASNAADTAAANGNGNTTKSAGSESESGPITTGNSRANCITLNFPDGVLDQSTINAATSLTGVVYNCIDTFANPVQSWSEWEAPWMLSTASDGWDAWLAQSSAHQVIVGMDLIPQAVSNDDDPLTWEQPCAAGSYDQYASTLAKNLVSYGAQNIVIRLGVEANDTGEDDYVGSTATEMSDWAKCFDNEVTAMRAVPGENFLFVWNPNVCANDLALDQWYPGNSYVDIIGVDAYDRDCLTLKTVSQEGWATYSTDSSGNTPNDPNFPSLTNIETFAAANKKSLSFPEWAIYSGTSDDATYVTDMAQVFNDGNFSFESYYDTGGAGVAMLGSAIPNATATYSQEFK